MFTRPHLNTRGVGRILAEPPSRGLVCKTIENSSNARVSRSTELCKLEKKSTIASIKYFSKHRNITMFICFHVKAPIDLSERVYYLKYFIIIDLIAVTWGVGRILAQPRRGFAKLWRILPICEYLDEAM